MPDNSGLAKRMKENYENRSRYCLPRRTHTIIRLDGKNFSTWTKGLQKPFDEGLIEDMVETTKYLCKEIQGVKFGYTQSDEISLLLTDYDELSTEAWFDGNIQKTASISASLATAKFNQLRLLRNCRELSIDAGYGLISYYDGLFRGDIEEVRLAHFDSRVFTIPEKDEVINYFLWRQRDAERNSVSMLSQSLYPHSELHKKNGNDMQEMCFQKGHNWNDLPPSKKRGSFIRKVLYVNDRQVYPSHLGSYIYFTEKRGELPSIGSLKYDGAENELYAILHGQGGWEPVIMGKVRHKWKADYDTPSFGKDREEILNMF